MYPAQKGIFLTVIGGFFDSSSTVLMIYQIIFDGGVARLFWISMTYAILSCFVMVRTLFLVPIRKFNHCVTIVCVCTCIPCLEP